MTVNTKPAIFQLNIPLTAHIQAKKFRSYQSQPHKARQIYLNTLGVSVVNSYLNLIGWSTSLESSDSWNLVSQTMMNVADLHIPSYGKLECRVVLSGQDKVKIPPEVWSERIGFVVVRLDKSLKVGTVLGFVGQVNQPELPLNQLQSLAKFPKYLSQQPRTAPANSANLSSWRRGKVESDWQKLDELFAPAAMNFRSRYETTLADQPLTAVSRAKLLKIGEQAEYTIALILRIQLEHKLQYTVSVTVCNYEQDNYLPEGLELVITDHTNRPVMNAQANKTKTIEFCFSGELEENFSVEIYFDKQFKVENFII